MAVEEPLDLAPRPDAAPRRRRRRLLPMLVLGAAIVGGGIVVAQFLGSAIDYYCNVDEIGVREGCDESRRLRVQGNVEQGSLDKRAGFTTFVLEFNGTRLAVDYEGDPGGVFQECIPVVAHGRIVDGDFLATRIEVRHSNEYEAQNADRIASSDMESAACSQQG
ncbi:MAG: cytochrome c maturation protein CcmE [Ilumatobacteraceae bacterium]